MDDARDPNGVAGGATGTGHAGDGAGSPLRVRSVDARQVLDSRGYPTIHVALRLDDDAIVEATTPAGASTGEFEAVELRDGGKPFSGRGVRRAIAAVAEEIAPLVSSREWTSLAELDRALRAQDGTANLSRLGANAVVAVSMAAARGFAHNAERPLHEWISAVSYSAELLPVPHFNVLNGGAHAANELDFQEFMIAPVGASSEEEAVQIGAEVYHALASLVRNTFHTAGLGDEGGFAPPLSDPRQALDLLVRAIGDAGYTAGRESVAIAIDPAANGFYVGEGRYRVAGRELTRENLADYYVTLLDSYPLRSIEDGFSEDDRPGWKELFDRVGSRVQLVGDDIFVTDPARIEQGARDGIANAALIKPNQIGTVSDTLEAIRVSRDNGLACMVSHRSGETGDTFIADLVVGTGVGQIKSGAPARGERVAKYNRLMEIEADTRALRYGLS